MVTKSSSKSTPERLLKVGEKLFACKGFHGVSLREVAKRAKTNLASVHYHFGDKYGFYAAIFENFFTRVRESIVAAKLEEQDPKSQVLALNRIMQKNMSENEDFNRMFSRALLSEGEPRLNAILQKVMVKNLKPLSDLVGKVTQGLKWKGLKGKISSRSFQFLMIAMNGYWTLFSKAYAPLFEEYASPEEMRQDVYASVTKLLENLAEKS